MSEEVLKNENKVASRSKIFLGAILDFCINLILLMILFGASLPILQNVGCYDDYNSKRSAFFNFIEETSLYTFDEDGEPINSEIEAANYILKMVKTTYFYNSEVYTELVNGNETVVTLESKDLLDYVENNHYVNDNLAEYFLNYRESSYCDLPTDVKEDFGSANNKYNFMYSTAMKLNLPSNANYFDNGIYDDSLNNINSYITGKPILSMSSAKILHDYICLNVTSEEATSIYSVLNVIYHNGLNYAFSELDEHSDRYNSLLLEVDEAQNGVYLAQFCALFICYLISFSLYFVVLPLFLKEGRTLGMKFSRLTYSQVNDELPKAKNIIIKDIILLFTQMIVMIIPIIFFANLNILFAQFIGIRILYIFIFLALLTIFSASCAGLSKNHQFLGEYASLLCQKDIDTVKVDD